jgi:hypothetical protein
MSMEVWPAETGYITIFVWTVVAEQKYGILVDNFLLVFDTQVLVYLGEFVVLKGFVTLRRIICKDDKTCLSLKAKLG